jgi:hypothetical protein
MDCFESYEVITEPLQVVQKDKTYSCEEVQWYNLKEGERYLMMHNTIQRIGTFEKFKWIEMYKQWMIHFTYVRTNAPIKEYCQEVSISGNLPYIYFKQNLIS